MCCGRDFSTELSGSSDMESCRFSFSFPVKAGGGGGVGVGGGGLRGLARRGRPEGYTLQHSYWLFEVQIAPRNDDPRGLEGLIMSLIL